MTLIEAIANDEVGYSVAVMTQILIFPAFGLHTTLAQNLQMGGIFTLMPTVVDKLQQALGRAPTAEEVAKARLAIWEITPA